MIGAANTSRVHRGAPRGIRKGTVSMEARDRQRCALALITMRDQIDLLTTLFKRVAADDLDDWNASKLDKGLHRMHDAVTAFLDEMDE